MIIHIFLISRQTVKMNKSENSNLECLRIKLNVGFLRIFEILRQFGEDA